MLDVVCTLLGIYIFVILGWIVLSWIRVPATHPVRRVEEFLGALVLPVIRPLDRLFPPLRLGNVSLAWGALIVILGVRVLQAVIC